MLAVLDDDSLRHPALECVITTDEEIGLLGAKALDTSVLKGKYLINLDSEEYGIRDYFQDVTLSPCAISSAAFKPL